MREAIGGISLFQIAIVFILLFTAIMCLTINHSKAFAVKDEIITIIEKKGLASSNGASSDKISAAAEEIAEYLNESGYRITGKCPAEWVGYDRNGQTTSDNASFCIKTNDVAEAYYGDLQEKCKNGKCSPSSEGYPAMFYYEVLLFYQLDIPIFGDAWNFTIYGSTKTLMG